PAAAGTRVVTADGGEVEVGRLLWTAPPTALAEAAGGPARLAGGLVHRGLVLVYLVVERPQWLEWDAHYVPDPDVAFVRLSEPKNYRDGPDPPDRTVLCAELPATAGDARWRAGDAELRDLVLAGIDRLGLPDPRPADVHVIRVPRVYPLLTPAAARDLAALLRWADDLPGVTVLGRQGLGVADNLHHVLDMAAAAAACLRPDGGWDHQQWTAALSGFERHVVED
ncbi:MAG: FAD-dependent oxidoreductase, partial [Actinobacteria bacterium]|nr:FAD-dependent oxidoreductase [Actinomycetota bacterium]